MLMMGQEARGENKDAGEREREVMDEWMDGNNKED